MAFVKFRSFTTAVDICRLKSYSSLHLHQSHLSSMDVLVAMKEDDMPSLNLVQKPDWSTVPASGESSQQ